MFKIQWHILEMYRTRTIEGLSHYPTEEKAQRQIDIWKQFFPSNRYYIVRA